MRTLEDLTRDTEPFPDSTVKTLEATEKRPALDYVPWSQYNQRLLLHHPDHDYIVDSVTYGGSRWAVAVHFVIAGKTYGGVGEDPASPDNAESNAYKRAAAHAGIGLHLYGGFWLHGKLEREKDAPQ